MDSICEFSPLWMEDEIIGRPRPAIEEIRVKALKLALESLRGSTEVPGLDTVIIESIGVMEALLWTLPDDNVILQRLRDLGDTLNTDPVSLAKASIGVWYTSVAPIIIRDPRQGQNPDAQRLFSGAPVWDREYSGEQHEIGNLGLMAMLMLSEQWTPPSDPKLRSAALISSATTTMLFCAYLLCPRLLQPIERTPPASYNLVAMKLFVQSAWQIAREGLDTFDKPPAVEFGATQNEIKLSHDGRRLLTKVGLDDWQEASMWHPARQMPGSPWGKFMRNLNREVFASRRPQPASFTIYITSSAAHLAHPLLQYYSILRERMDQTGFERARLSASELDRQFQSLSEGSGSPYPNRTFNFRDAVGHSTILQEYLFRIPMTKKYMTDLRGSLTLPFLSSAARAFRFESEPPEVQRDLDVMAFRV